MGTRENRRHPREYIVIPATLLPQAEDDKPLAGSLNDVSISGARFRSEWHVPESTPVVLLVEPLKFQAEGRVVRTYRMASGWDIAVRFDSLHPELPGKLLEYKLSRKGARLSQRARWVRW